jgi:hypothetical protein
MANKSVRQHLVQQAWQGKRFLNSANHRENEPLTQRGHRTCRAETIKPYLLIRTSKRSSLWLPPISSPTYTNQRFSGLLFYNKKQILQITALVGFQ